MLLQPPAKYRENGGLLLRPVLLMPAGHSRNLYKNGVSVVPHALCGVGDGVETAENKQTTHYLPPRSFTEAKERQFLSVQAGTTESHKGALLQLGVSQ